MYFRFLSILILAGASCLAAQDVIQPGQLASTVLPTLDARPMVSVIRTASQDWHERNMNRLWIASVAAFGGATGMDAATSWGKHEGNGLLASSNGEFGARGLSIKAGIAAAILLPQLMLHKESRWRNRFLIANLVDAGIFTGVALHNTTVTAPPK